MVPEDSILTNHFLIAMPSLDDPNFSRTVTYICEHNEHGAMGLVLNRPSELTLAEMFEQMKISKITPELANRQIFSGGPVGGERGFVLHTHTHPWDATLEITPEISVTTSRDILSAMARNEGPEKFLVTLGYAGWGPGQLEQEIQDNAWLSGPADPSIIFDLPPEARWEAAALLLGVDLHLISTEAGHA